MKHLFKFSHQSVFYLLTCLVSAVAIFLGSPVIAVEKYVDDEVYGMYEKRSMGKTPVYGGTYRTHFFPPPRSFDPHIETATETVAAINLTYSGLLRLAPRMDEIELDAAESWRQIDDLTYEFKLRKGIRFHDIPPVNGREMISADVKYSIERLTGMHGKKAHFKHSYYFAGKLDYIKTPDRYTIVIKTKRPYAPFIRYIASAFSKIVPKEAVDKFGDLKRKSIGTGPFTLKEYVKGSHMLFVKNPNYFIKGRPYLDAVHFRITPNVNTRMAAFLAGKMDGIGIYPFQIKTILEKQPDLIMTEWPNLFTWIVRTSPWAKGKIEPKVPFGDRRVRQAIAHAIDKKKVLQLSWFGAGQPQVGPIPRTFKPWGLSEADQWEYNPEKAKKLLAEAGYPNGFSCEMITWNAPYMTKPMQVVQQMLAEVGIKAKLNPMEFAQYLNKAYRYEYDLALHITIAGVDPSEWLVPYFGKLETSTYYKWSNPVLWDLIEKQEYIMDQAERLKAVQKIQRMIMNEAMSQSIYVQTRYFVAKPYVHFNPYFHAFSINHELVSMWMEKR
jgi:peptide/nickel transport system substrate-binding protein